MKKNRVIEDVNLTSSKVLVHTHYLDFGAHVLSYILYGLAWAYPTIPKMDDLEVQPLEGPHNLPELIAASKRVPAWSIKIIILSLIYNERLLGN